METSKEAKLTGKLTILRAELKAWERQFAAANNGAKASRDDIKRHPDIAAKYKEYNKTRDIHAANIASEAQSASHPTPRRRKLEESSHDENKRQQIFRTPSKGTNLAWYEDGHDSPSVVRSLFTPSRKSLAPTPQKDGLVLGLFDLLRDSNNLASPSRPRSTTPTRVLMSVDDSHSKPKTEPNRSIKHTITSNLSEKKSVSNVFATPSKKSRCDEGEVKTPLTVSKLNFSTPSFLRRDNILRKPQSASDTADFFDLSPRINRIARKAPLKSLSSILADLRDIQDEELDEDLEALREMEADEANASQPLAQPKFQPALSTPDSMQSIQSARPTGILIGGLDDEASQDRDLEAAQDSSHQPPKPYKKRGQKRTTRKVVMKPTRTQLAPVPEASLEDEDPPPPSPAEADAGHLDDTARNFDSDSQSEYTASEGETRYRRPKQESKSIVAPQTDGKTPAARRKVSAKAHTNYKRLKLRNFGASGPSRNPRFRRKKL